MKRMTDEEFAGADNLAQQWWSPDHVAMRLSDEARRARAEEERYRKRVERLEAALRPFATFALRFALKPIPNAERADILYGIHAGEEALEADLRLSHCRAALKALEAE